MGVGALDRQAVFGVRKQLWAGDWVCAPQDLDLPGTPPDSPHFGTCKLVECLGHTNAHTNMHARILSPAVQLSRFRDFVFCLSSDFDGRVVARGSSEQRARTRGDHQCRSSLHRRSLRRQSGLCLGGELLTNKPRQLNPKNSTRWMLSAYLLGRCRRCARGCGRRGRARNEIGCREFGAELITLLCLPEQRLTGDVGAQFGAEEEGAREPAVQRVALFGRLSQSITKPESKGGGVSHGNQIHTEPVFTTLFTGFAAILPL